MQAKLDLCGLKYETEKPIDVMYKGQLLGQYRLDLLVEGSLITELKAVSALCEEHIAQVTSYLKATEKKVGLVLNFNRPKLEIKRVVWRYEDQIPEISPFYVDAPHRLGQNAY